MRRAAQLQKVLIALALGPTVGTTSMCNRAGMSLEGVIAVGVLAAALTSPVTVPIVALTTAIGLVFGPLRPEEVGEGDE